MIYSADITTPANTSADSPLKTRIRVTKGLVYHFHIYGPHGAMGLHYCQVFDGSFQLWPASPGQAFRGDGLDNHFDDLYLKQSEPYEFQVVTWNLDETYEHLYIVNLSMVSNPEFMSRYIPALGSESIQEKLAELYVQQERLKAEVLAEGFEGIRIL